MDKLNGIVNSKDSVNIQQMYVPKNKRAIATWLTVTKWHIAEGVTDSPIAGPLERHQGPAGKVLCVYHGLLLALLRHYCK